MNQVVPTHSQLASELISAPKQLWLPVLGKRHGECNPVDFPWALHSFWYQWLWTGYVGWKWETWFTPTCRDMSRKWPLEVPAQPHSSCNMRLHGVLFCLLCYLSTCSSTWKCLAWSSGSSVFPVSGFHSALFFHTIQTRWSYAGAEIMPGVGIGDESSRFGSQTLIKFVHINCAYQFAAQFQIYTFDSGFLDWLWIPIMKWSEGCLPFPSSLKSETYWMSI